MRCTPPVQWIAPAFVPSPDRQSVREPNHVRKLPLYPAAYYLNFFQIYCFRDERLKHLRVEVLNRYFAMAGQEKSATLEETETDDEGDFSTDDQHRNADAYCETAVPPGTVFKSRCPALPSCRSRRPTALGVARTPYIDCVGGPALAACQPAS